MMAHVALIARHPQFADSLPDLPELTRPSRRAMLSRVRRSAVPFGLGAGVGAGVVLALGALGSRKPSSFSLFAAPRSSLLGNLAKVALIAVGRTILRRALG